VVCHFNSQLRLIVCYLSLADVSSLDHCSLISVLIDLADSPGSAGGVVISCGMGNLTSALRRDKGFFTSPKQPRLGLGPTSSSQRVPGSWAKLTEV
jgi:hypothetical protein